ncbi:oxoglutarate/iron-dependent oxygenase [Artemisia annua]|uniref:Oxoglutarate/iron-dependent oxygenase n=1 Tax=Artemisia annua TaxID=35608 RepID=A0A2U1NSG3_ARTAN|nr:oxoglutarate/iron-dependent oxygenase [Artemisia annua]
MPHQIKESQPKANKDWSECAKKGYAVKPKKGDGLLFFSLHPNATTDVLSLHGSCPVIEGEKWSVINEPNGFISGTLTNQITQVTNAMMKMLTARHGLPVVNA